MEVLFPTIFLVLLGFVLLLNVITLPANWIMLGLIGLWRFAYPSPGDMGVFFFAMLVGLALFGEVIEYIAQGWGSKKYGSSTSGMWAGLFGALVGALAGLPLLFGLRCGSPGLRRPFPIQTAVLGQKSFRPDTPSPESPCPRR